MSRTLLLAMVLSAVNLAAKADELSLAPERSTSIDHVRRMCWVTHIEPARCVYHPGYHFAGPWYDMGDEWHRVWYWQPPWVEHIPARTVRRLEPCHNLHILDTLQHGMPSVERIEEHPGRGGRRGKE